MLVLAKLEKALPIYWNTSTRHYLLHMYSTILSLGHFWSISMMGVERLHVLIKSLSKGRKNLLATFEKKYALFCQSQLQWRHATDHVWSSAGAHSAMNKEPVEEAKSYVVLMGKQHKRTASDWQFQQLQDQWAIRCNPYDRFRDRYYTYKSNCEEKKETPVAFHKWNARAQEIEVRQKQQKWQSMDRTMYEVQRLEMDKVLFRTERVQNMKGVKTDNSYIVGETITTGRVPGRPRARRQEKCYGRLQHFYLHFMYPPPVEELASATEDGRIDPNKITSVPWAVFAHCKWYEEHGTNPNNGLTQVQYNQNWDACPFICMDNCLSQNCQLWPSVPYDDEKYDGEGKLKPDCFDFQDYTLELHDVMYYHE